jgi:hypothetical protein
MPQGEAALPPAIPEDPAVDAIGEILSAEPLPDGTDPLADPLAEGVDPEAAEAEPPVTPRRYRRSRSRPDDWKKGYGIFGGG